MTAATTDRKIRPQLSDAQLVELMDLIKGAKTAAK